MTMPKPFKIRKILRDCSIISLKFHSLASAPSLMDKLAGDRDVLA